jgi:sodium-dependent dicarboxylate transporter 2/3/5
VQQLVFMPVQYAEDVGSTPKPAWRIFFGLAAFGLVYLLASGLEPNQRVVAATFAGAVVLWMTEALPLAMTAMLSTAVLVLTGALSTKEAFGAYGDQIILLFIGSFIIAKAMEDSGLDRRIAFLLLSRPWATKSASVTVLTLGVLACGISLFVSNTATTAMLLPIGLTILKAIGTIKRGDPITTSLLLMLTWGSSVAVGTIIGTPPNVLGVGMIRENANVSVNFLQWAAFAMPITILMLGFAWFNLTRWGKSVHVPDTDEAHPFATEELKKLGPLRDSEKVTVLAFTVAITLWILPGAMEYILGSGTPAAKAWADRVPEAVAALLGASVLFAIPCRDTASKRAMTWSQATTVEWGTILLFAGGLALGKATFDSGLAKVAGESVAQALGAADVWTITAISIGLAILISELASNTASATIMVPVAMSLAQGAGVSPIPPALGATIGSNLGFMLPISTAPNAIVYSSGLIPPGVMLRAGIWFDLIGFAVTLACLRVILPMIGLA